MLVVAMLTAATSGLMQAQNSVHFRPNATIGQDAIIVNIPGSTAANTNYATNPELDMAAWTWGAQGYGIGYIRSLIKFTQLNTIPTNATILSAQLVLHGVSSGGVGTPVPQGNNYYPGTTLNYPNDLYIQRVISPWNENTVTWNTPLSITTTDQISVPYSTAQWNLNCTVNSQQLVNMVQSMVSNPNNNNGFLIRLQNEVKYRSFVFGSSDHANKEYWPEISVTYCDPNFSYCFNTVDTNYTFSAAYTDSIGTHNWIIYNASGDTIKTSTLASFNHVFAAVGSYQICHTLTFPYDSNGSCQYCINICVDSQQVATIDSTKKMEKVYRDVMTGTIPPMDVIIGDPIKVYPNPSLDDWNVTLTSEKAESVDVIITDCSGKIVSNDKKNLTKGDNSFVLEGSKLPKGIYVLEIKGEATNFTQKLSKN